MNYVPLVLPLPPFLSDIPHPFSHQNGQKSGGGERSVCSAAGPWPRVVWENTIGLSNLFFPGDTFKAFTLNFETKKGILSPFLLPTLILKENQEAMFSTPFIVKFLARQKCPLFGTPSTVPA